MAAKKKPKPAASKPPVIHEAELASGPSGAVLKGAVIDVATAINRRQQGLDVVVCGDDHKANRALARDVEFAVGRCKLEVPHQRAGPHALPHYQQEERGLKGHCFYETANRKARKS